MARNEEKAQSMLYRFREAQAAELGLGTRGDRRPRMASACKSLRECERWRGEILREISRKVSKIQDSGLTDYEVRDLNDEINRLLREKRHWENQIIALGGANYRRNVAMLDDDGREVPGTKGYKYFGRAKELPGVKELFESRKKEEDEENATHNFYKKYTNQGPAYFGDLDELDGELLKYEEAAEQAGWEEAHANLREVLGLPDDTPVPKIPQGAGAPSSNATPSDNPPSAAPDSKRKVRDDGGDGTPVPESDGELAKRSKPGSLVPPPPPDVTQVDVAATTLAHARAAAAQIPFLSVESLLPPKMPTKEEMESVLLELRKRALVEEYFGN
ncbi:pre-mRNA-splicing factor ISY1 [Lactarius sanguifluus]|nr:pre-mRNA-splicing factor ISY1 [Lactarius sanguifluus]